MELLKAKWPETPCVIIAGNHDVDRKDSTQRQKAFLDFIQTLYGERFTSVHPLLPEAFDRNLLVAFQDVVVNGTNGSSNRLLVVGVNSAAALEDKGIPVHVAPQTLTKIDEELSKRSADEFRIFALHHHLLPFAESNIEGSADERSDIDRADPSIVGNSAKLQSWLARNEFSLVLHGHKHKSHGRMDTLWRKSDPRLGRTILIAGAGSAGVSDFGPGADPLSYNIIHVHRLAAKRWSVEANIREIHSDDGLNAARDLYTYSADVGASPSSDLHIYQAQHMDDCHSAIFRKASKGGLLRTFVSVVEACEYKHPSTTSSDGKTATEADVIRSFKALHPEHGPSARWTQLETVERTLKALPERYQFQHGPRLFGIPYEHRSLLSEHMEKRDLLRPIIRALKQLTINSEAQAYVSLSRPDDLLSSPNQPLPSLMSLQFLKDGNNLDLIATFRKIELSFWWVVNMYEAIELLTWAANYGSQAVGERTRTPRRITFVAALAEWKEKPDSAFVAELDGADLGTLTSIALATTKTSGVTKLIELLEEKKLHTNPQNLDHIGLAQFAQILNAAIRTFETSSPALQAACNKISEAAEKIQTEISRPAEASFRCIRSLDDAITELKKI
jgi:hypothetical protein